jgi:hypothetical protein
MHDKVVEIRSRDYWFKIVECPEQAGAAVLGVEASERADLFIGAVLAIAPARAFFTSADDNHSSGTTCGGE